MGNLPIFVKIYCMELWLDNPEIEQQFKHLLKTITLYKSGEVADNLRQRGIDYRLNWGVSLLDLRRIASEYPPSHLLALKLWNKQWRETMILATLLDEPGMVTEQQMDFWAKSFTNSEIAEQASANLFWRTPWAYIKALEWCRGKKHWQRYTAIHLVGRLAMMDKKSPDEMFEAFFEELIPLSRDPQLAIVLERALIVMAHRSDGMLQMVSDLLSLLKTSDSEAAFTLAQQTEAGI